MLKRVSGFMIPLVFTAISARGDDPSVEPTASVGPLVSMVPSMLELGSSWLVLSAGAYGVPAVGDFPTRFAADLRLDVVIKRKNGNTFTLGLGAGARSQGHTPARLGGFHFGGSF